MGARAAGREAEGRKRGRAGHPMTDQTLRARTGVSRFLAIISYFGILCFVPLVLNKDDPFVHFHARQGLVLWMWNVLAMLAILLPAIGQMFFSVSMFLVVLFSLIGVVSAAANRTWKIPLVHNVSQVL